MSSGEHEVRNVLAGVACRDLERSAGWMSSVVGREPDARPMDGLIEWHLPDGATLQLVHDPERAGGSIVSLVVPDIAATQAHLATAGIDFTFDDTTSTVVRFGELQDPDGNHVAVIETKK